MWMIQDNILTCGTVPQALLPDGESDCPEMDIFIDRIVKLEVM